MANAFQNPSLITKEAAAIFHEEAQFLRNINKQYDDQYFGNGGAKHGATLRVRKPAKYTALDGRVASTVQDSTDNQVLFTVATQSHVRMDFTSAEMAQDIEMFTERHIRPAALALVAKVEADCYRRAVMATSNTVLSSAAAGVPSGSMKDYQKARAMLNRYTAPKGKDRRMFIDSDSSTEIVDGLKALTESSGRIAGQYDSGMMTRAAGWDWYESEYSPVLQNSSKVAGLTVSATLAEGATTLTLAGTVAADVYRAGTVFTIANVFSVNPETKQATSQLQQFTITADVTAVGTTTAVAISPSVFFNSPSATTPNQRNVSKLPTAADVITVVGTANQNLRSNLGFHKDAFSFATTDLEVPKDTSFGDRAVYDGINLRFVRQYDAVSDSYVNRLDILYGFVAVNPEWAVRIAY